MVLQVKCEVCGELVRIRPKAGAKYFRHCTRQQKIPENMTYPKGESESTESVESQETETIPKKGVEVNEIDLKSESDKLLEETPEIPTYRCRGCGEITISNIKCTNCGVEFQ